jgi:hypothetical protein
LNDRLNDRLLARKEVVQVTSAYACFFADTGDAGTVKAIAPETPECGVENGRSALFTAAGKWWAQSFNSKKVEQAL